MLRKANKLFDELNWKRKHRTLVVVEISGHASEDYKERAQRFVDSLNTSDTIKADVFVLFDGLLEPLLAGMENRNLRLPMKGLKFGGRSQSSLKKFAKKSGYTQFCVITTTENS